MTALKSWHITPTAAGFLKSKYISGDDTAAPPVWATIPDFRQKSAVFSVDVSAYLTGSTTSYVLSVVSGTLAGSGWSFSGSTLSYSGTGSGLLTGRVTAYNGPTTSAVSNIFTFESLVAPAADTIATTIPTGLTAVVDASNHVILTCKACSDPADPGVIWSGTKDYKFSRGGAPLATVNAPDTGLKFPMASKLIGSPAIVGAASQSGAGITITGGGVAYANTADEGRLYGGVLASGNFFACMKVTAFTSSNTGSKLMIVARTSTGTDSAHVSATLYPFAGGLGYDLESRPLQGQQTLIGVRQATAVSPRWLALGRVAASNTYTMYTSVDGLKWFVTDTIVVNMPGQIELGVICAACQAGVTASATIIEWNVTQATDVTYTDTTTVVNTTYSYAVASRDNAGTPNVSAECTAISVSVGVSTVDRYASYSFQGLTLVPARMLADGTGGWDDITGTDGVSAISYPRAPSAPGPVAMWGGTAPNIDSIQIIADNPNIDITAAIVAGVAGPLGPNVSVLRYVFVNPYNPTVGGKAGRTAQLAHVLWPDTAVAQSMVYLREWIWLQADLSARNPGFFPMYATKTATNSERHIANIIKRSYSWNVLAWQLNHDKTNGSPSGGFANYVSRILSPSLATAPLITGQTYIAPIPLGQWFKLEIAHKFVYGQDGWIWMALTIPGSADPTLQAGVQVFYEKGAVTQTYNGVVYSTGWNPVDNQKMNRIFPMGAYSDLTRTSGSTYRIDRTTVELWRNWPSDATAHPNVT